MWLRFSSKGAPSLSIAASSFFQCSHALGMLFCLRQSLAAKTSRAKPAMANIPAGAPGASHVVKNSAHFGMPLVGSSALAWEGAIATIETARMTARERDIKEGMD